MNTTALDGRECFICGENAEGTALLQGHAHEVPLCDRCMDAVEQCPDCAQQFWGPDGYRIYATSAIYCASCAAKQPTLVVGRMVELHRDMEQGK